MCTNLSEFRYRLINSKQNIRLNPGNRESTVCCGPPFYSFFETNRKQDKNSSFKYDTMFQRSMHGIIISIFFESIAHSSTLLTLILIGYLRDTFNSLSLTYPTLSIIPTSTLYTHQPNHKYISRWTMQPYWISAKH